MRKSLDKRIFNRIKTPSLFMDYKIKGGDTVYKAELVNLSAGGICFLRNSIINKGDLLVVRFPFMSRKILLTGHVLRVDGREVGIKFLNTEEEVAQFVDLFNKEYPNFSRHHRKDHKLLIPGQEDDPPEKSLKRVLDSDE